MKSFMKKVTMSALALAIVMIGIVSRTEVVKAGVSNAWDDNGTWVFKIIPEDEKLILTKTDVSGHKPNTAFCNAKLLYSYHNNEPTEIFIGDNAFHSAEAEVTTVTTVTIETEIIDREGFSNPAGILNIGNNAFRTCPELTEFNCQRNVKIKIIGNSSFEFCRVLKTIDLTEVENIGNAAFYGCEYLEKIKFNKVNSIGDNAFYNCISLQEVDFGEWVEDTECNIAGNAFAGVGSVGGENNPVLILPDGWTGDEPDENGKWHGGYFRYIKSMSISDDTIVLTEEESKQLTVETSPIESENKAVTWSSSDESVATVDENGKVTAVSAGNATITVTSTIDERKTVTCNVTVNHDFKSLGVDKHKCSVCNIETEHNYDEVTHICSNCNQEDCRITGNHDYSKLDNTKHKCSLCGLEVEHLFGDYQDKDGKHYQVCADCGAETTHTAHDVIEKIDVIGTVAYTNACKAKIDAARSAYDALTATQKSQVTNYAILTAAEAEYARLKPVPGPANPPAPGPSDPGPSTPEPSDPGKQYSEVVPSAGTIKDITSSGEAKAETNPYSASIINSSALETLVKVTAEEKAQGVNVWIKIVDASSTMSATDKAAIQGVAGDHTIGMYLDATLFKKVGTGTPTKVSDLNGKIRISLVIPENLRKEGRTFEIIRVHNGTPTVIQGTYDATTYTFTFETDQFSSYAIAYKDNGSNNGKDVTAPKTGDPYDSRVWYLLLIASLGGMLVLGGLRRKDKASK